MADHQNKSMVVWLRAIIFGVLIGTLVMIGLSALFAFAIVKFNVPATAISIVVTMSAAIGSFMGGLIAAKIVGKKGLFVGVGLGVIFFVVLFFASFFVTDGSSFAENLTKYIAVVVAAMIGGIFGVNLRKSRS